MWVILQAIFAGLLVLFAGTIPRNIFYWLNLRYYTTVPWGAILTATFLVFFWWFLRGWGADPTVAARRREQLRAEPVRLALWGWSLLAGGFGIVSLVFALGIVNRFVLLPQQEVPDLSGVPNYTIAVLLFVSAPVAGVIEESAFRGYMQGPIERRYGLPVAILITGTMFAVVHLDFTPILWPYYVAVAAIYGTVTFLVDSIRPAIVLHSVGNLYSNFDLWWNGQAEWQRSAVGGSSADDALGAWIGGFLVAGTIMLWGYFQLAKAAKANGRA